MDNGREEIVVVEQVRREVDELYQQVRRMRHEGLTEVVLRSNTREVKIRLCQDAETCLLDEVDQQLYQQWKSLGKELEYRKELASEEEVLARKLSQQSNQRQ